MNNEQSPVNNRQFVRNSVEAAISIGLVVILVYWCFDIVKPFITPIIWGIILAVAMYPLYLRLQVIQRGHQSIAAILCTLFLLVLVIVPTVLLTDSLVESVQYLAQGFGNGTLTIPPPPESVGSWPIVGKPVVGLWRLASENIEAALQQIAPHLKVVGSWLLTTAEHAGLGVLQFMVAIIISGFLLPQTKSGKRFALLIASHFIGEKGEPLIDLAQATVRSVALGVLGVAAIQSILAGLGFIVAGVPAAGLWTLLCLLLSIVQVGIVLVVIPIIIYIFYHADTFTAVTFLVWIIPVTFIDTFLKPILLSRGVKTPMVVIFLGAIGGFLQSGIVGLFTGAVILSLSYALFMNRIKEGSQYDDKSHESSG
jgi:predicted PurR-regulated permease PerM